MTLSTRPHVFLVAHAIHDGGGMERACAELIRRAHDEFRFTVVSVELAGELRQFCDWIRVPAPRRPMPLRFVAFFLLGGLTVATRKPDLVHTVGAIVPNRIDVAAVHFCHAGYRGSGNRRSREGMGALRWLSLAIGQRLALVAEQFCYRPTRVGAFAAVSEGVARELQTHYPGVAVVQTPNGVDTGRYRPDRAWRTQLRTELGVDDGELVALFVGGDWAHKGLALAIEALGLASERGVDLSLWVLGKGRTAPLEAFADRHGVRSRVRFFGTRPDTERFYAAADLFVLPTAYETFSLVAHEAAAAGLPVIAPAVSGITELVGRDEAGLIVPRTPEGVAAAFVALGRDRQLRERLGQAGRDKVAVRTWDQAVKSVTELYRQQLERRRGTKGRRSGG